MSEPRTMRLISKAAVCQRLGLSERVVEEMAKAKRDGFPRIIKVDRNHYFNVELIEKFEERAAKNKGVKRSSHKPLPAFVDLPA